MATFANSEKYKERYNDFLNSVAFRRECGSYINYLINARRNGYSIEILRRQAKTIADKFLRPISDPNRFDDNLNAVLLERDRQIGLFKAIGVDDSITPEERANTLDDPGPSWCEPRDKKSNLSEDEIRRLARHTRVIHGLASALFAFTGGNLEDNIWIWRLAKATPELENDINVNTSLFEFLYLAWRDFDEILDVVNTVLARVEHLADTVERFQPDINNDDDTDRKIREQIIERYIRAKLLSRMDLSYLWSEKGLSLGNATGDEQVPWQTVQRYAQEAYEMFDTAPRLNCIDDDRELTIKDTYAFVKLAFAVYNLNT
jgi:hypothetical protein